MYDCRIYVSEDYVNNVLNIPYHEFMNSENFIKFQPGIYETRLIKYIKKNTSNPLQSSTYRGFFVSETKEIPDSQKEYERYIKKHKEKTKNLIQRLHYINLIIQNISVQYTNKKSPILLIMQMFPICKWCVFFY